ncbi:MAG TPA: metallophosphoesterase [Candidatus Obscuribacterales bacterium]
MTITTIGLDIIGDLHGHYRALLALLAELGYLEEDGLYQHPEGRQLIFVGDLVDRGPHVRETVQLVRALVESGRARCLLANHEYNILCYHLWVNGEFLRVHSESNARQVLATLQAFADDPGEWLDHLEWFKTLPLFLELPGLRVVHACWDQHWIDYVRGRLPGALLTPSFVYESSRKGTPAHKAVETLLKGWEATLPECRFYHDAEGIARSQARLRWWPGRGEAWGDWLVTDAGATGCEQLPFDESLLPGPLYPEEAPPVFCGHYWLRGTPRLQAANVCCLDYSIAKAGQLVAYRWNGEQELQAENLVAVG